MDRLLDQDQVTQEWLSILNGETNPQELVEKMEQAAKAPAAPAPAASLGPKHNADNDEISQREIRGRLQLDSEDEDDEDDDDDDDEFEIDDDSDEEEGGGGGGNNRAESSSPSSSSAESNTAAAEEEDEDEGALSSSSSPSAKLAWSKRELIAHLRGPLGLPGIASKFELEAVDGKNLALMEREDLLAPQPQGFGMDAFDPEFAAVWALALELKEALAESDNRAAGAPR